MGKGDNYRPTDHKKYNANYDNIQWDDDEQRAPVSEPDLLERLREFGLGDADFDLERDPNG